jgi:hypothetical protein
MERSSTSGTAGGTRTTIPSIVRSSYRSASRGVPNRTAGHSCRCPPHQPPRNGAGASSQTGPPWARANAAASGVKESTGRVCPGREGRATSEARADRPHPLPAPRGEGGVRGARARGGPPPRA